MKTLAFLLVMLFTIAMKPLFACEPESPAENLVGISKIKIRTLGRTFYYFLHDKTLKSIQKEISLDLYADIFLNPVLETHDIKIRVIKLEKIPVIKIQRLNKLGDFLYDSSDEKSYGEEESSSYEEDSVDIIEKLDSEPEHFNLCPIDDITDEKDLLEKITEFAKKEWQIDIELAKLTQFINLETITKNDIEKVAYYYLKSLFDYALIESEKGLVEKFKLYQ